LSDARRLGLVSSLYAHHTGIVLQIYGYDKLLLGSLKIVLGVLQDLEIDESQFAMVKKPTVDPYRHVEVGFPGIHASRLAQWLTGDSYSDCELTDELESIMASDIRQFCPFFFGQMHIQLFAHGNVVNKDAIEFADLIKATLKPRGLPKTQWSLIRSPILPSGTYVYRKALHPDIINSSIEYLVFFGDGELAHAKTLLLS
jgi:insulysin